MECLQKNVSEYTRENRILQDQNNAFRDEVVRLRSEVVRLNQTCNIFHAKIASLTPSGSSMVPQIRDHRSDLLHQALTLGLGTQNDFINQIPLPIFTPGQRTNIPENTSSFHFTNDGNSLHTTRQLQHILPTRNSSVIDRTSQHLLQQQLGASSTARPALDCEYFAETL